MMTDKFCDGRYLNKKCTNKRNEMKHKAIDNYSMMSFKEVEYY